MNKTYVYGIICALFVVITTTVLTAFSGDGSKVFTLSEASPSVQLVVNTDNNSLYVQDDTQKYDLYESLLSKVFLARGSLYDEKLKDIKKVSISKKYSDLTIYMVELEFEIERCVQDVNNTCELRQGGAQFELNLGYEKDTDSLSVLSLSEVELKYLW